MLAGTTGVTLPISVLDTTSGSGAGLAGLLFNTAGLSAEYRRQGQSSSTAIALQTATLGTWTSGGFVADGSRGDYELGIPDAVLAAGARWAIVRLYGVTAMLDVKVEIELDAVNYQDAAAFGLSRLDAAVSSRLASAGYTAPDNATVGLIYGVVDTEIAAIKAKVDAWDLLEITGGTVNDPSPTAGGFVGSAGLSATNSFYVGRLLCFTAGPLAGLKQPVTGYVGATRTFAFSTPFPAAPANGNAFVII